MESETEIRRQQVVIIGGGFGGLNAARALRREAIDVTLVDRRDFHLFQPLLYTVATGGLAPGEIVSPLRAVLKQQTNTRVLAADVVDIDPQNRRVILLDGELAYDTLIVATGVTHHYFGHDDDWGALAPGLKTVEDALEMRRRVLLAYETAERVPQAAERDAWLTFVIVGGGPTGVELAGSLAELAHHSLKGEFRRFDPAQTRILLLEGQERLLPGFPEKLSRIAEETLVKRGVTVCTRSMLDKMDERSVTLRDMDSDTTSTIATRTVLWAAGVRASSLGQTLAERTDAPTDRIGRLLVGPDLSLPEWPDIFVIGDLAGYQHDGEPLPGVAQVAIQMGNHIGKVLEARRVGRPVPSFHYKDRGNLAVIGRNAAVADIGRIQRGGYFAWMIWLFIHINSLVEMGNKLAVFVDWSWAYLTRGRGNRLITGDRPYPVLKEERGTE